MQRGLRIRSTYGSTSASISSVTLTDAPTRPTGCAITSSAMRLASHPGGGGLLNRSDLNRTTGGAMLDLMQSMSSFVSRKKGTLATSPQHVGEPTPQPNVTQPFTESYPNRFQITYQPQSKSPVLPFRSQIPLQGLLRRDHRSSTPGRRMVATLPGFHHRQAVPPRCEIL